MNLPGRQSRDMSFPSLWTPTLKKENRYRGMTTACGLRFAKGHPCPAAFWSSLILRREPDLWRVLPLREREPSSEALTGNNLQIVHSDLARGTRGHVVPQLAPSAIKG